jgi:hypothetical protein
MTTRERAKTIFSGIVDTTTGEITEQYVPVRQARYGFYMLLWPMERYDAHAIVPNYYILDVIGGTCNCPQFGNCGECKHCWALQDLVFRGIAPGMPAEWIAEYYCPEMCPNSGLSAELDTTTDTSATATETFPAVTATPFLSRYADLPKSSTDIYQPCPVCQQPVPRGEMCFRNHAVTPAMLVNADTRKMDWA